jgi:hypothetical protein
MKNVDINTDGLNGSELIKLLESSAEDTSLGFQIDRRKSARRHDPAESTIFPQRESYTFAGRSSKGSVHLNYAFGLDDLTRGVNGALQSDVVEYAKEMGIFFNDLKPGQCRRRLIGDQRYELINITFRGDAGQKFVYCLKGKIHEKNRIRGVSN